MSTLTYKFIILLGALAVSLSSIIVKSTTAPAIVMVFYRTGIASLLLLPFVLKNKAELKTISKKTFGLCVLSGGFLALHFFCYFSSVHYTTISSASIMVNTEVFFVALLAFLLFKEKPSKKALLGILISFIGSIIIALSDSSGTANTALIGNMMALAGASFGAVYTIIGVVCRESLSTNIYTSILYMSCAFVSLMIALFTKTPITGYDNINLLYGVLLAVIPTILGHNVYSWGLKYLSSTFVATVKLMEPVFATILAIFIYSQIPGAKSIFGGVLVIAGILVFITVKSPAPANKKEQ